MTLPGTSQTLSTDVVVIGGGPGGSTTATMLARKGLRMVLLERARFPREHIGESLLPASMPVLQELGVLDAVAAEGFTEKWGATMVWGAEPEPWSWYFKETSSRWPHTYQVHRPRFDQILLENSRAHGVDVREGHQVTEVLFDDASPPDAGSRNNRHQPAGPRATGVRYQTDSGEAGQINARFVVDASGQQALIGHKLRLRRWDDFFQNLAIYAYFDGAPRLPAPDQGNIFIESYPHGWFWNIPLHPDRMSAGAVVDSRYGQEGIRRLGPHGFLMEQIGGTRRSAEMLRAATLVAGPTVIKDWSYRSEEVVGDGYILVGDAACFVDPLFSSGIHLAFTAAVLASAYITTVLTNPDQELRTAAASVYKDLYYRQYGHFREMAKLFYSSNRTVESYFWEARRIINADEALSPRHAFLRAVAGQSPLGYERAVVERGAPPVAFVAGMRAVESDRTARRARLAAISNGAEAPLYRAIPRLAAEAAVLRRPVLAEGEFVWGEVLTTAGYPEGTPASALVARLVGLIDGRTSVSGVLARLCGDYDQAHHPAIIQNALAAVGILYVDGTITELAGV